MTNTGKELSLDEIRKAQAEIAVEMGKSRLSKAGQLSLEQATIHLRNLERILVSSIEKEMIATLKKETMSLNALTAEMDQTSKRLFKLTEILRKVIKITGQLIDILELVK